MRFWLCYGRLGGYIWCSAAIARVLDRMKIVLAWMMARWCWFGADGVFHDEFLDEITVRLDGDVSRLIRMRIGPQNRHSNARVRLNEIMRKLSWCKSLRYVVQCEFRFVYELTVNFDGNPILLRWDFTVYDVIVKSVFTSVFYLEFQPLRRACKNQPLLRALFHWKITKIDRITYLFTFYRINNAKIQQFSFRYLQKGFLQIITEFLW